MPRRSLSVRRKRSVRARARAAHPGKAPPTRRGGEGGSARRFGGMYLPMREPQTSAVPVASPRSRAALVPWLVLAVAFVLLVPLSARPVDEVALVAGAVMLVLATRSIAYPLGLAGFAAPIVALAGHDPFPPRAVPLILFAWIVVALVFEGRRSGQVLVPGALQSWPFFLTLALAVLLLVRLPASTAASYGDFKVELFVLSNLVLFVAGIALGA